MAGIMKCGIDTSKFDSFTDRLIGGLPATMRILVIKGLALKFIERVASDTGPSIKTPVRTGRARAGWTAMADDEGVTISVGGNDPAGVAEGKKKSFYKIESTMASCRVSIHNAVHYIVDLEYGSSRQAPGGFVRINLEAMRTGAKGPALVALRNLFAASNRGGRP